MIVPSALKCLLLAGAFLAFVWCCSLNSSGSTSPKHAGSEETVQAIAVFESDALAKPVSSLPHSAAASHESAGKAPDTATPAKCPQDGKTAPANTSVISGCSRTDGSGSGPASTTGTPATTPPSLAVERVALTTPKPVDRNREIYYRNKTELAFDLGAFPINIPFPFDFMEGDPYTEHPLKYTLVPIMLSLRWHMTNLGGAWIFRGNWDLTSTGSFTWIPSGPETRFISYDMGLRRNFVPHNRNYAPYFEIRLGVGQINAKGPHGVAYAQGQNWPEYTMNMGTGLRYNFSPRFAFTAGLNYMHLSNMDTSEHKPTATDPHWGAINYGINVYGPAFGFNVRLGKKSHLE